MNHVSYTEFLNNIEHIIDTAIEYDIFTAVNTDKGNRTFPAGCPIYPNFQLLK